MNATPHALTSPPRMVLILGYEDPNTSDVLRTFDSKDLWDIFIVEPDAAAFEDSVKKGASDALLQDPRLHLVVGQSPEEIFASFMKLLSSFDRLFARHCTAIIRSTASDQKAEMILQQWQTAVGMLPLLFGTTDDSLLGFKHCVENRKWIEKTPGIQNLRQSFPQAPAVVVATGPSLTKSLTQLKTLQSKAIIVSCDASYPILLKNGITPDFVCSIERDQEVLPFIRDPKETTTEFVAFPVVAPNVLSAFKGPSWVAYRDYPYFSHLEKKLPRGILACGSSVAHMAVQIASTLGCNPIVLVGQDLAYDPDRYFSHAEGMTYTEWTREQSLSDLETKLKQSGQGELQWVPGNIRDKVPTSGLYLYYNKQFSLEKSRVTSKIINCTEGGAKIFGIPWRPLSEVSASWKDKPAVKALLNSKRQTETNSSFPYEDWKRRIQNYLAIHEKLALELSSLASSLETPIAQKKFNDIRKRYWDCFFEADFLELVFEFNARTLINLETEWHRLPRHQSVLSRRFEILTEILRTNLNVMKQELKIFE